MRSIWTGAVAFGLVNIPVKMFSGSQQSELNLDMLDKDKHSRIHYKRVKESDGKEVEYKDIVKGYKYKGKYVILEDKDFAAASPKKSSTIEVNAFVQQEEIQSVYYENPYYLVPEKSGVKAYNLFFEALQKSEKAGVASFVMRNKEHLCVLLPYDNVIVLNTIRFAEEVRDPSELTIPKHTKPKPQELKMAMALIDQLTSKFKIDKFKDTYSADLMKLIHKKAKMKKGKKVEEEEEEPKMRVSHRKAEDLIAQLKASIKKAS